MNMMIGYHVSQRRYDVDHMRYVPFEMIMKADIEESTCYEDGKELL